ncbi:uncharacterized protein LOC120139462 [Hibiscus syriacus]|uniref:uncharacterized protein LOC120139462 n=1 Tax=Hibiscus syriacus TaxID=106335 RepID=UPI00192046B7|nr:uncharacterized protein LOC120139462 [Hibiscus syriacus]XP_039010602.1 uncharacterized protein LOC120139462 [Hibiscus syriacus]
MENLIKQSRKQNWFQKQFSGRHSEDGRPKQGAHEAAVAAAAFAVQSVEEAKTKKLKKDNGRNGLFHTNVITTQFSLKKTKSSGEKSKDRPIKHKPKEFERVGSQSAAIVPIAPGDYAEWYDKLKFVVCGSDKMPKTHD